MHAIRDLLGGALVELLGPRRVHQAAVLSAWEDVVGPARARHAWPAGIRGTTLVVETDLPALLYEIRMRRASLLNDLNRRAGDRVIDDLHISLRPGGMPARGATDNRTYDR